MHAALLAFGTRYVGDAARAEELVQDVFFTLWERRAEWIVTGTVPAYLFSAVRSRALNVRRRDAVEQRWADDEAYEHARALHPDPPRADHPFDRRGNRGIGRGDSDPPGHDEPDARVGEQRRSNPKKKNAER
jgi:DNA-directed RNA polymerase specialized sigma24 family protein